MYVQGILTNFAKEFLRFDMASPHRVVYLGFGHESIDLWVTLGTSQFHRGEPHWWLLNLGSYWEVRKTSKWDLVGGTSQGSIRIWRVSDRQTFLLVLSVSSLPWVQQPPHHIPQSRYYGSFLAQSTAYCWLSWELEVSWKLGSKHIFSLISWFIYLPQ